MIDYSKTSQIMYGGDYNPEQWPEESWPEDMHMLRDAGINIVTLNVFSWAAIQPSEEVYDFSRLDRIADLVTENGMKICLATATGALPAWMARRHPDILRVDNQGRRHKFGGRENFCPNSPTFRKYAPALAGKLAEHYRDNKNIWAWHVSNEYSDRCCCENCTAAYRKWLRNRYGSVEALNSAWNTAFWGHTYYDFDEIVIPDETSEEFEDGNRSVFISDSIDYRRFMSESLLNAYQLEYDAIKKEIPDACITTNLMGFYKPLDYGKWAKKMDFISWDSYPSNGDSYSCISMPHDLMRGLKDGDPYAMMEQTPSVTNWQRYNALKRPGVMRLQSYQAIAHGSDTVMFFQMKQSRGECEKLHGAIISHSCTENTRVFREAASLGKELKKIGPEILGSRTVSDIAMIFDWENWWGVEFSAGPSRDLHMLDEFRKFYEALRCMNYNIDIVQPGSDISKYRIAIAPVWYMVKGRDDEWIRTFVKNGGVFITTFFSGIVDESDLVTLGGYPGKLRDVLGIWVEETDALPDGASNSFRYKKTIYPAKICCDLIHLENAERVDDSGYDSDFYKGLPVVTVNKFGRGKAYYIASSSDAGFYTEFLKNVCREKKAEPVLSAPEGIEVTSRENSEFRYIFVLNQTADEKKIRIPFACTELISGRKRRAGSLVLAGRDVRILKVRL